MSMDRDINDLFGDIILSEERFAESSYKEGYTDGCAQGNEEGYRLGYAQGLQLGEELAQIFGLVVAVQHQAEYPEKVKRCLEQLRERIELFPKENDPEADIVGSIENIRTLNKKLLVLLGRQKKTDEISDLKSQNLSF